MTERLAALLYAVRANFWFIPTVLALMAIGGGMTIVEMDVAIQYTTLIPLHMSVESARLALSTIAGSMITIASLVFSMTLVALTTVSQQLGPRILLRFIDDRPTQVVLGIFVATFLFSLIVLLRIGDNERAGIVPGLGVTVSAGLAIASLGGMIHFFDHVARRIQADSLIAELGRDLKSAATTFVERANSSTRSLSLDDRVQIEGKFEENDNLRDVRQVRSGYLRRLDEDGLCQVCEKHDQIARLDVRPGKFVFQGERIMVIVPNDRAGKPASDEVCEQLARLLLVADQRTAEASIEFEIDALVEVALRAMSRGVNDPFTAITCVDHLADGLRLLSGAAGDREVAKDRAGVIRVLHCEQPFTRYLERAFDPILKAASDGGMVRQRIARIVHDLIELSPNHATRDALDDFRSSRLSDEQGVAMAEQ